jgi:hypothetical protein
MSGIEWDDPDEAKELQEHVPAERPSGETSSRISFEGEVERQQTDHMARQIMGQIGVTNDLVGRSIVHALVLDDAGWLARDRGVFIKLNDGKMYRIEEIQEWPS